MTNFFDGVDKTKLDNAINLIKNNIGPSEIMKIEKAVKDQRELEKLLDGLGSKERAAILKIMNDPQLLSAILTSPKAREGIKKFLSER